MAFWAVLLVCFCVVATGCSRPRFLGGKPDFNGTASWYGNEYHGRTTASGEVFNQNALTGAHRDWPFGTIVKVTNRRNGRSVTIRINDRGPWVRGRDIDVSREAARQLDMIQAGVVPVRIEVQRWGPG
jgi:rare lipoprotein A